MCSVGDVRRSCNAHRPAHHPTDCPVAAPSATGPGRNAVCGVIDRKTRVSGKQGAIR